MAKEDDPFAEFEDWLVDGPAGRWPYPWETENELTREQQTIVENNAALLQDRDAWKERVDAFEGAIRALQDKGEQKKMRAAYFIRFDKFVFEYGEKDFSKLYFPCSVSFAAAQFRREDVDFGGARFGEGSVDFRRTLFEGGDVDFKGAKFGKGNVDFSEARFEKGHVGFHKAQLGEGKVSFRGAKFGRGASFSHAQFGRGDVDFKGAKFGNGHVSFGKAKFGEGDVNFGHVQFGEGDVYFGDAQFGEGHVYFRNAEFGKGVVSIFSLKLSATAITAHDMEVAGTLYVSVHFPLNADFRRLKVTESASFSGCKFEQVPDFRDAKFDRPPDVANMEVSAPKLKIDRFWPFSTAEDPDDASRLRKLKAMALDASDHERDSYFFAREMQAKRGVETKSWPGLLVNTLYDWLSVYGYSFLRPLGWLAASLVFFFCIYACVVQDNFGLSSMLCFAALHSGLNFLPLVGGLFRYAPTPDKYTSPYEKLYAQLPDADISLLVTLGIIQSIIGGILLFLFLLALRNRFRLK